MMKCSGNQQHYTTVRIFNKMKDGSSFTIHCKSKDDDLGSHVIEVGKSYEWKFRINFWSTTLFFCNTYWKDKFIGFNAFDAKRDSTRCDWVCIWDGFEDGLYGYLEKPPIPDLHYVWK
ncbi:hypothetical protein K2173_006758 [Erythroxylum novogranatense]|uniref:S-protein homolog n=1 Tax=Erythroxylum novogranatense TaxID=1862640 RepID=A0AAV8SY44_9ROSI|nr:hypothetical protein K2173_006758 [Erythroxylum novogranatense]